MPQNIKELIEEAKKGDPKAQYSLAVRYHNGQDGEKNYEQAAFWYRKAADQGHVKAAFYLGVLYQNGKGVEQNYQESEKLFMSAADSGYDKAQLALGIMYAKGIGVEKDYDMAAVCFQEAADQGNEKAVTWLNSLPESKSEEKNHSENKSSRSFSIPEWLKWTGIIAGVVSVFTAIFLVIWSYWPTGKKELNDIVSEVLPATVFINVKTNTGSATGSGFFALNGKIFTNAHVVEGAKTITIKTHNGKTYDAEILDTNKELDLAVLTANVSKRDYSNLSFASKIPAHGTDIVVIGSPLGYEQTVSNGIISAVRTYDDMTILQITAPISGGSSGSPVVNMQGKVIGIAAATNIKGQNINFAVSPLSARRKFSGQDIYLVEHDVPIANDGKQDSLRVNKSSSGLSKSPENEKVRVIDSEFFEVRTVAKVQSISSRKIYWIDSSSVMRPVEMNLDEFIARFNDGAADSEAIQKSRFTVTASTAFINEAAKKLIITMDEKTHNIKDVFIGISKQEMNSAQGLHPFIQRTINVFYPIPVISHSDFYKKLLEYNFGSFAIGKFKKFPVEFIMMYNTDTDSLFTVILNNNSKQLTNTSQVGSPSSTATNVPRITTTKKKKKGDRDPEYLNEIRVAFKGMQDIKEDVFQECFFYYPQKYSTYAHRLDFMPYIMHNRKTGTVVFWMNIGFENSDWVFTKKIIFNCDGKNFTLEHLTETQRDVFFGGGIYERYYEWLMRNIKQSEMFFEKSLVESIISAKKVRIRFSGSRSIAERTLSKKDQQNLAKCYECYKKLVALEERWEN